MKLRIVPARTGLLWVRQGCRTYFRQPLAMTGLFLLFMLVITVAGWIPIIGLALALALLPACTLGLMAATKEAAAGKFPMPTVFLSAFRAGRQQLRAMAILGVLYGMSFWLAMGVSALFDDGQFARMYLHGGIPTMEAAQDPSVQVAVFVFLGLQMLLSLMFWHAPALVHWHQVPPIKSIFFSLVACFRNFGAFTVFALSWLALLMAAILCVSLLAGAVGGPATAATALWLLIMVMAAMFFTSLYFTFEGSFDTGQETQP